MTPRTITSSAFFAALSLAAAPAGAQSIDDAALAAVNAAVAGVWSGTETFPDETDGPGDIAVTFAVVGDDGLDAAVWASDFLILFDYVGEGAYVQQFVGPGAPGARTEGRWVAVEAPDAAGNWSRTTLLPSPSAPEGPTVARRRESMTDGVLTVVAEEAASPEGPFETYWTLTLTRED